MFHRDVFSACPPVGDYILRSTGLTWNIGYSTPDGSLVQVAVGARTKSVALATLLMWAGRGEADAWEMFGADSYRLVKRYRPHV